jgi:hypothetical protein
MGKSISCHISVSTVVVGTGFVKSGSSMIQLSDQRPLQLRRAISIQAEAIRSLEKHAIAPAAASACSVAPLDYICIWQL